MTTIKPPGFGTSFSGFSLGQRMVPGPEEEIPTPPTGSGLRVSVWDGATDDIIEGAVVTARRLDGIGVERKDTTGKIGTAILAFPDAPLGTALLVKVSAKGYRTMEFQIRTVSRSEAETRDPAMGYVVDLERSSGLVEIEPSSELVELIVVAAIAGALYWALS